MKFLNNIEVGATPNFTLPLADGSSNQILQTNGSGTVTWVDKPAGSTDTNDYVTGAAFNTSTGVITLTVQNQSNVTVDIDGRYITAETHTSQGYLTDTGTSLLNVLANYNTTDTVGWASESNTLNSVNFRLMSDGSQLSLANDQWADRNTGGVSPKYFIHMAADGAGSPRSSVLADADEFFSVKIAQDKAYMAIRNADNSAGQETGIVFRNDNDDSTIRIKGIAGGDSVTNETFRIESVQGAASRHRLHITNYGDNHMRISQTSADQPIMYYWGNGTAMGNSTNTFATLGARFNSASLAIGGTNVPSEPSFRYLDDGDTGMYLASTGVTAFSSGGTKVFTIPASSGSNGQVLTTNGSGTNSWTTVSSGSTYSAGAGLDLNSTTFSLESDLRGDVEFVGSSSDDYIQFDSNSGTQMDFYVGGSLIGAWVNDGNPELHCDGDIIAYSTSISDARLKEDVETIQSASKKVSELRGVEYTWKAGSRKGQREIGFIAQEVETVVPQIVREKNVFIDGKISEDKYKTVDYEKLIALLVESNKEQQEIISQLEERVIDLENRV